MPAGLPRPGTLRWDLLAWLCRNDSGTAGELADALDPPPRFPGPVRNGEDYRNRQRVRAEHRAKARATVRRELSALQRCGLVCTAGPARLEPWAWLAWKNDGPQAVLRHVWDTGLTDSTFDGDADPDDVQGEESPGADGALAERIVAALYVCPMRRRDLCIELTGRERESGAFERAYGRLCDRGVIVPPTLRRPTDEGRALILSTPGHRAPSTTTPT